MNLQSLKHLHTPICQQHAEVNRAIQIYNCFQEHMTQISMPHLLTLTYTKMLAQDQKLNLYLRD